MGFIGNLFGNKKALGGTPKLPDAPSVPDPKALEAEQRAKMRDRQRSASGGKTLLTTSQGLQEQAPTQSKSLLGV